MNIRWLSAKVANKLNTLQEAVGHGCLKMRCFTLGSVETHLRSVSITRVDGPSWRVSKNAPKFSGRQLGPWTRVVETDL